MPFTIVYAQFMRNEESSIQTHTNAQGDKKEHDCMESDIAPCFGFTIYEIVNMTRWSRSCGYGTSGISHFANERKDKLLRP